MCLAGRVLEHRLLPPVPFCAAGLCQPGQSTLPSAIAFVVVAPPLEHRKSRPFIF